MLQSTVTGFGIERPMVGIHIRRTDKVSGNPARASIYNENEKPTLR